MIKLKNIIIENFNDSAISILKNDCSEALSLFKEGVIFYRGVKKQFDYIVQDPSLRYRTTLGNEQTTYFQVVCDEIWPDETQRRHKSVIFTKDLRNSRIYGNPYFLFPFNGATISYGTQGDNWDNYASSLKKLNGMEKAFDLNQLNNTIIEVTSALNINVPNWKGENIQSCREDFKNIDSILLYENEDEIYQILSSHKPSQTMYVDNNTFIGFFKNVKKFKGVENLLKFILDANSNNIKTVNLNSAEIKEGLTKNEFWTESKCLLVNVKLEKKIDSIVLSNTK